MWRSLLLGMCVLAFCATVAQVIDMYGLGERPWFGYWDAALLSTGQPFVAGFEPRTEGAVARAGIRPGDRIDLREQSLTVRAWVVFQPSRTATLLVRRDGRTFVANVKNSAIWEGAPLWKVPPNLLAVLAGLCFLVCAGLIAVRRAGDPDARLLAFVLIFLVLYRFTPVMPSGEPSLAIYLVSRISLLLASWLLVRLASRFGARSRWRTALEWFTYATIIFRFGISAGIVVGIVTLWIDPLPLILSTGWPLAADLAALAICAAAVAAVYATPLANRPRAAWLLLPVPIAMMISSIAVNTARASQTWYATVGIQGIGNLAMLLGAIAVTYALLNRRVLDAGFVIGRSIVVAAISLIVVAAFVLLEWILGSVLAGVSHTTGIVANAALALALGLSMRFIHKRVDGVVDTVMFGKRRADERALRDFSKEAAHVTESGALLDRAISELREHTDAVAAAIYLQNGNGYRAARSFGEISDSAGENDPAILALKTWTKPLDPHSYQTVLCGDLALPMLARGRLLGVLVCGRRIGGETYAPEEVDALAEFAHGVGTAVDGLAHNAAGSQPALVDTLRAIEASIAALPNEIVRSLRAARESENTDRS